MNNWREVLQVKNFNVPEEKRKYSLNLSDLPDSRVEAVRKYLQEDINKGWNDKYLTVYRVDRLGALPGNGYRYVVYVSGPSEHFPEFENVLELPKGKKVS